MKGKYEKQLIETAKAAVFKKAMHTGSVKWESPSNIAIVKYWGKKPVQVPTNASMSITLDKARTITKVKYEVNSAVTGPETSFFFEGIEETSFAKRIDSYLASLTGFLPWLKNAKLTIESSNTFPHSSGIASSASSMSALAMCLCEIDSRITGTDMDAEMNQKASFLARLGSGSASRSVWPGMAVWGKTAAWKDASDEYAIPADTMHKAFRDTRDAILIIESGKKKVSSTLGHALMDDNPFAKTRFKQAEANIQRLRDVIESGDWNAFIDLMEHEALTLHAMMMTSNPGYILMQPGTLTAIERLRTFRKETAVPVGFTLDAGANMHVIYPVSAEKKVGKLIDEQLKELCENEMIIFDGMGNGPDRSGPVS